MHKSAASKIACVLVVIGGINWGLVGLGMLMGKMGGWNIVNMLLGSMPTLEGIVYVLVGISAVMMTLEHKGSKMAGTEGKMM